MKRFHPRLWLGALLAGLAISASAADDYPTKPIQVIVPYPPGGTTDTVVRLIMQDVSQRLRQPILVDNKPGASGSVGTAAASVAPPDGYTFAAVINAFVLSPLTGNRTFNPAKLTGVSILVSYPIVLAVGAGQPWQSLRDLAADARKRGPDGLTYASSGMAGHSHIASEMLAQTLGVKMVHVPYAGDAARLSDLKEGRVSFGYFGTPFATAQHKAGTLRALAVTGEERSALLPDVPTVAEQGFPELKTTGWVALLAPAGVPAAIQDRVAKEIAEAVKNEELQRKLVAQGVVPVGTTPEEARSFLAREFAESEHQIERLGVRNVPR